MAYPAQEGLPYVVVTYTPRWTSGPEVRTYWDRLSAYYYASTQARGHPGEEEYRYSLVYRLDNQRSLLEKD